MAKMGRNVAGVALALLLAAVPVWAEEPQAQWVQASAPSALPPLSLLDLEGQEQAALPAAPSVLLHFWATWCGPCVEELPALDQLAADLAPQGIIVVAVSEDRGGAEDVRPFLAHHAPLSHLILRLDPKRAAARALHLSSLPVSILLNAQGEEVARLVGNGDWRAGDNLDRARLLALLSLSR